MSLDQILKWLLSPTRVMYINGMYLAMKSEILSVSVLRHAIRVGLATTLAFSGHAGALTIFRIGGESLPDPDPQTLGAPAFRSALVG